MRATAATAWLWLGLLACNETGVSSLEEAPTPLSPRIEVSPPELAFDRLGPQEHQDLAVTLTNAGNAPLTLTSPELITEGDFLLLDAPTAEVLAPGASRLLNVRFQPVGVHDRRGELGILSDDQGQPRVRVPLLGEGAVPQLAIEPSTYDFYDAQLDCPEIATLTLRSVGETAVEVTYLELVGEQMTLQADLLLPLTLQPGEEVPVVVQLEPSEAAGAWAELTALSTDPAGPRSARLLADVGFGREQTDRFELPADLPVDILFAVDQSGSMDDDQAILATNFRTFIEELGTFTRGWHVGVVTQDSGCFNGGVITESTPNYIGAFTSAVSGGGGGLTEALLGLSTVALAQTPPGRCNSLFLREDAPLHIIVVTDEPEQSGRTTYDLLADLGRWVTDPEMLRISGVIDTSPYGLTGYFPAIFETGGVMLDIRDDGWGESIESLADASRSLVQRFELSEVPVEETLEVSVEGILTTDGWTYDPEQNSVFLTVDAQMGLEITIRYHVAQDCEV